MQRLKKFNNFFFFFFSKYLGCGVSTVVEQSPHFLKVEGSSTATAAADAEREKMAKKTV
jgi:hypothetical protein